MDSRSGHFIGHSMTNRGEQALPTELWAHIFSFVPVVTICQVRLVCRWWRDIVASWPAVLDRVRVVLEKPENSAVIMDEDFEVPPLLLVSNATLTNWTIIDVDWWQNVGQKLREISICRCTVQMAALLRLAEHSPNLQCLRLKELQIRGIGPISQPNFQVERMQKLTMSDVQYDGLTVVNALEVFVLIFPRLRDFLLRNAGRVENLDWLVHRLQGTLERLEVIPEESLLPEICRLQELRLKRLAFDAREPFNGEDWDRLYRAQPHLEELIVVVDRNSILHDIGRTSQITALTLHLVNQIPMGVLNELTRLRYLEIEGFTFNHHAALLLARSQAGPIRCPALREFRMTQIRLYESVEFFMLCPLISTIKLNDIKLEKSIATSSPATFPSLRHLDVSGCYWVSPILLFLFANSPLLEHVRLTHMIEVNDEIMRCLCQRVTRLRKLELDQCPLLSDASGEAILENCAGLEELRLYGSRFSTAMVLRLKARKAMRVWYTQFGGL